MADSASPLVNDPSELLAEGAEPGAARFLPALAVAAWIVVAPLPFGSAHGGALWLVQAIPLLAAAMLLGTEGTGGATSRLRPLRAPAALLGALCLLQMVPLPLAALDALSPTLAMLDRELVDSSARWFPASVNAHASLVSLVRLVALGGAFLIAAHAPLPGRRSLFYWAILVSGAISAAAAWAHAAAGWDTLLFGEFSAHQAVAPTPRLHWPLLNPNHLAAALNVTTIVAVGAFLTPTLLGARGGARDWQMHRTLALVTALLSVSATIATKSRGGLAAAVAALAMLALLWPVSGPGSRRAVAVVRMIAVAAVLVGLAWLARRTLSGVDQSTVLAALERRDATLQVRLEIVRQGARMLWDFPWLGTGLGTWGDVFPRYQRYPLLFATVTHAHSEPLEWATDLGMPGAVAILWLGGAFLWHARGVRDDDARRRRAILIAALGSLFVHALGDFALRVPSVALVAAVLLGLLWRETTLPGVAAGATSDSQRGLGLPDGFALGACCAVLLLLAGLEWRDERLLAAIAAKEEVAMPEMADWKVFEALSRRRVAAGESGLDPALRAVWASPLSASGHHALAYGYVSDQMRERELRRTVACQPATRFWRLEHAIALAALGQFPMARVEIEQGFYYDPQYGDEGWLRFQDPVDATWPFLEAALRGVRRRVATAPEMGNELRRFEALQDLLRRAYERRRHGG